MPAHRFRLALALLLFAPALAGLAADKDVYGDPLPEGAKARLGTTRLRSSGYATALLSPDAKTLYVSGFNGIRLLDPATGAVVGRLPTTPPGALIGFSADGKRGLQNTFDSIVVWDTGSGKTRGKYTGSTPGGEWGATLSADGKVLARGGSADGAKKLPPKVVIWSVDDNKEITTISPPQNQYVNAVLSPDGKAVAVWGSHYDPNAKPEDQESSPGRYVYFYDATSGKELSKFRGAGYTPQAVAIGPAGLAAVFTGNSSADLVDVKTGASKFLLLGRARMGRFVTFSPDGSVVAATSEDGAAQLWRTADGARVATVEPPVPGVYNTRVRMLDNEKGIAWGTRNLATFAWEVPSGKSLGQTEGHTGTVSAITVTPDGKQVLTSSEAGGILRWELATGKLLGEVALKQPGGSSAGYAPPAKFSPDGTRALVRESYSGVGVFDMTTGSQWYTIPVANFASPFETFSPDGSKVILAQLAGDDPKKKPARVQVFDTVTGKRVGGVELLGYTRLAAALTPDGKHLITAGTKTGDANAQTFVATGWELATGAKKGELTGKSEFYQPQVVAAPDNKTAGVATSDGKVIVFDFLEGKSVRSFDLKQRRPGAPLVLTPDGKQLAVACQPSFGPETTAPVVVFDWASGKEVQSLSVPGQTPQVMAFSPDGKTLVTSAADTTALVWELSK